MSILAKIGEFVSGGVGGKIIDTVKDYFPPSMSEAEKSELSLRISEAEHKKEIELLKLTNEADKEFNNRIKDLEGTASDLKSVPVIGHIIILLRGAQRPLWGFATMYIDFMALSNTWNIPDGSGLNLVLIAINILVLGFLFGERAIKNVMPFIIQFFGGKNFGGKKE